MLPYSVLVPWHSLRVVVSRLEMRRETKNGIGYV
jgi:hypothetical protein